MTSRALRLYRSGTAVTRWIPLPPLVATADGIGSLVGRRSTGRRDGLASNLRVVCPDLGPIEIDRLVRRGFASYARYWAETLKLPSLSAETIDAGMRVTGFEHIESARRGGFGPILALPHLGGWEWAAAYLGRVLHIPVSAVVERLEPDDLFEWFVALRQSYGVSVIPLGPSAIGQLTAAVRERHVVCLLSDRDIAGGGVEVSFFGRSVTMPAGPALLARRTGAPLHPCAVYFETSPGQSAANGHHCIIDPGIEVGRGGSLRTDVAATTQRVAHALERLVERAPEQWHVLEPLFDERGARR